MPKRPHRPHRLTPLLLALPWLALPCALGGDPATSEQSPPAVVTSIQDYWDLPLAVRRQGVDYAFEGDVTYYDPVWGHFFLQDSRTGTYFELGEGPPDIRENRRIRISGFLGTGRNLTATGSRVAVLGSAAPAPLPLPAEGWIEQPDQFDNRLVELEAFVDRQVLTDPRHLHLFLVAGGRPFFGWVLLPPGEPEPDFAQQTVRLQGVFTIMRSVSGHPAAIEIKIQSPGQVHPLHRLERDPAFARPVSTINALRERPRNGLVRIVGTVRGQQPGTSLTLRDDTGQIEVRGAQTTPFRIGDTVEAIGYPDIVGTEWKLRAALYRPFHLEAPPAPATSEPGLSTIRVVSRVLELGTDEAARRYPVELSGVVTWSRPDVPFLFLHDSSGGIRIQRTEGQIRFVEPGRHIVVRGTTALGPFAPVVIAESVRKIGDLPLPPADSVSLEHALTGACEAQWVELRGYVREIQREDDWHVLVLTTPAGDFSALLPASEELPVLAGAVVRARGICTADTDRQRRLRAVRLWLRAPEDIQIEEMPPHDLFALPSQSLAELGRFGAPQISDHRVRLSGTVLAQLKGRWIQIQDADATLRILTRETAPVAPGQRVDAVGFLNRRGNRMVLREAVYRVAGEGTLPAPVPFSGTSADAPDHDGRLVVTEGELLNTTRVGDETRLNLLVPAGICSVFADSPIAVDLPPQSRLAVVGLLDASYDEQGQPAGYRIRARHAADVTVLQRPSWFTPRRLLGIVATLGLGAGLALLWVGVLRRRVQRQTDQIRGQMQREARLEAELQRATRLESLGLLAGGIAHDFNNLLTVIIGNLSMASLDPGLDDESRDHVRAASRATLRARDLTQQLLTFAKGGSPVRSALSLPDLVQEVAEFVLRGTGVDCEFSFSTKLWPAHVDKGQISQVVQNLVLNAVQAMPGGGHIRIDLANEEVAPGESRLLAPGRYLRMTIADDGTGIPPEVLPRIFDPYFTTKKTGSGIGLATVYSIVRKHGGHITVESTVGVGTTFQLRLPASDEAPTALAARPLTPDTASLSGRVLLMDDEQEIRRLATHMLQHLGLEVHSVADGAAAAEEYTRALRDGRRYDLVVLDLTIPGGMGGLQTLRRLREIDPEVCAVVSSGYSEDEVMATYRSHGFRAMVPKPYGIEELARALRPLLRDSVGQPGAD